MSTPPASQMTTYTGVESSSDPPRVVERSRAAAVAYHATSAALAAPMRVHAQLVGHGVVSCRGQALDEVDYWLKDVEETDRTVFPAGDGELGAPTDAMTGSRGLFGYARGSSRTPVLAKYVGALLELRLEDGRVLECTAVKVLTAEESLYASYLLLGYGTPR